MKIKSLKNKQIINWNKLKQKKYRDQEGLFLIEGKHLIEEARKAGYLVSTIGLSSSCDFEVTEDILKKLSSQPKPPEEIGICKKIDEKAIAGNIILLDDIQDPGNLGTIIRSAVAFHIDTIILSPNSVDLYNEKVLRASEGMIFNLNIIRKDLIECITQIKQEGYSVYATTVNGTTSIDKKEKVAIIIGNEGNGIKKEILELCDGNITIPMDKKCESLNAGVSASIVMYMLDVEK